MPAPSQSPSRTRFERYAIFWAPDQRSPLARFGTRWLGAGAALAAETGIAADEIAAATAEPRRYGFHGTLHAPFRLKSGIDAKTLSDHVKRFAAARPPLPLSPLKLERIGSFLALVVPDSARESKIRGLHIQCLFGLEAYRGENAPHDAARRAANAGKTTEKLLVAQWGYAHVLHLFRFHLTLTGSLDEAALARFSKALTDMTQSLESEPIMLDALCLYGDPGGGETLQLIDRHPLGGAAGA